MSEGGMFMVDRKLSNIYNMPISDLVYHDRYPGCGWAEDIETTKTLQTYFEKVSFEQFKTDWINTIGGNFDLMTEEEVNAIVRQVYDGIELPTRSTMGSAGYDIKSPMWFKLQPQESIMIPTGIRCHMRNDLVLMIYPRSGLGTKYRTMLANTIGVIDSDYFYADNDGHIMVKLCNDGDKEVDIDNGKAFCQGVFTQYFTTDDDVTTGVRSGGLGSTDAH